MPAALPTWEPKRGLGMPYFHYSSFAFALTFASTYVALASAGSNSCLTDISAVIPKVFYISLSSREQEQR